LGTLFFYFPLAPYPSRLTIHKWAGVIHGHHSRRTIKSEYENVPDEAFMILVFDQAALEGVSGIAKYRPEFGPAI